MLLVKGIKKSFTDVKAVDNITFELKEGIILGILGKNGAGKSTVFRVILDILKADEGIVLLDEKEYSIKDSRKVGFLPEEGSLSQELTVYEQLCFYASLKDMSENLVFEELTKWLVRFDIMEYMNKKIKELSKGNRQRIQFIAAILHNPEIIILDEPFSGLDPLGVEKFKEILVELKNDGKSIIFSSHRMEHVEMFCDEILLMDKGKALCYGNLDIIKEDYPKKKVVIHNDKQKHEKILDVDKIDEYLKTIGETENSKVQIENLSLNDIFIDKVGGQNEK